MPSAARQDRTRSSATSSRRRWPPDKPPAPGGAAICETDQLQGVGNGAGVGVIARVERRALFDGEFGLGFGFLEDDADAGPPAGAGGSRIDAKDADVAAAAPTVPFQDFYGRRLSRPVRAQERDHLPGEDIEVYPGNSVGPVVGHAQTANLNDGSGVELRGRGVLRCQQ